MCNFRRLLVGLVYDFSSQGVTIEIPFASILHGRGQEGYFHQSGPAFAGGVILDVRW